MYRSKRDVLASIKERRTVKDGKEYSLWTAFLGVDDVGKRKVRVARSSREELEKYIGEFYARLKAGGEMLVTLTPQEAADARGALDLLAQAQVAKTLTECVWITIEGTGAKDVCRPVRIERAIAEHMERDLGELTRKTVRSQLTRWAETFGADRMTNEITAAEVLKYLKTYDAPKTYNNILGTLKAFFNWCMKKPRQYMADNPATELEKRKMVYRPPEYMPAKDVEKLARALEEDADKSKLALFCLSFFCGIRREEIVRLATDPNAGKVDVENRLITVIKCKGWERGIPPRAFAPTDNMMAWMKSFDFAKAMKGISQDTVKEVGMAAKRLGIKWPKNVGRHTFITMHVAWQQGAAITATIAGNSEPILKRHYRNIGVPQAEGEAYFKIMPKGC